MNRRPCPDLRHLRDEIFARIRSMFIERPDGCWEWQRNVNSFGYAQVVFRRKNWTVTRLMMCITHGAFDEQLDVCHTCDNTRCVNPLHLWLGTRKQNSQDCIEKGRHYKAVRTHCPRGHAYAEHGVRFGWPEELAFTLPVQQGRFKKTGEAYGRGTRIRRGPKTHCIHGHPLSGDNLYVVPSDGRRQCRTCKLHVIQRIAAERQQSNGN